MRDALLILSGVLGAAILYFLLRFWRSASPGSLDFDEQDSASDGSRIVITINGESHHYDSIDEVPAHLRKFLKM